MEAIQEEKEQLFSDDPYPEVKLSEEFDIWAETEPRNDDDALVSKFMEDMMPTKLFCRKPLHGNELWVFWSQESSNSEHTSTNWGIQDRIKIALSKFFSTTVGEVELLVQFWAAEMIGGRCHFTTTLQPFALRNLSNEKLNRYRKHCVGYKFLVADVENDDKDLIMADGIVGRVFRNQLPEYCEDLSFYSVREYPQRDLASSCSISSTMVFPVFEPSGGVLGCVGVLELLCTTKFHPVYWYIYKVEEALEDAGLRTIDTRKFQSKIYSINDGHLLKEIKAALEQVRETYKLTHAIPWVRCAHISCDRSCNDPGASFQRELLVAHCDISIFSPYDLARVEYLLNTAPLRVHQGPVGRAFSSLTPYFCRDVCQLSISEYPLIHYARRFGLAACFAICLRTISTGTLDFVIEFLLPRNEKYSGDLVSLFSSILETMKQQLKSFEVVIGDPENEIFTEVHQFGVSYVKTSRGKGKSVIYKEQSNTSFTSYKTLSAPTTSDEEHTETEYSYKTLSAPTLLDDEHIETEYSYETLSAPTMPDEEHIEAEYSYETISAATMPHEEHREIDYSPHNIHMIEYTSNGMHRIYVCPSYKRKFVRATSESSFSVNQSAQRADLHYGFRDLDSKAFFEQSESGGSGNSETASTNILKLFGCMMTVSQPHSRRDTSHSDAPLSEASAVVAHNVPPSTPVPDVELITVKVKFGEEFIKFELPLSAGKVDLVDNVVMRLRMLKNKAFVIKYLDDSNEEILLATDKELQDFVVRTRSMGNNLLRMFIQLEEDEELPDYMDDS